MSVSWKNLTTTAALLALALSGAACVAESGPGSSDDLTTITGDHAQTEGSGSGAKGSSSSGSSGGKATAEATNGPMQGPIPVPWQPPEGQSAADPLGSDSLGESPVPSPWMNPNPDQQQQQMSQAAPAANGAAVAPDPAKQRASQ